LLASAVTGSYQAEVTLVMGRSVGTAEQAAIEKLAEVIGIEPSYRDTEGHIQHTSPGSKRGVLQSMGFDLYSENAIHAALHQREEVDWHHLVAPATVFRRLAGTTPSLTVTLPDALLSRSMDWCVEPEGSSMFAGTLMPASLDVLEHHTVRCGTFVRMRLPLPMELNDGYHRVNLVIAGVESAATLVITPPTAFVPDWVERGERQWGIACPLFSLWSDASWGIGDFSELASFVRIARDLDASVVGLNPLHALLSGEMSDPSPYLPSSRLFLNPAYIDVTKVLTADDRQRGAGFGLDPNFAARIAQAQSASLVDYPLVYQLKQEALEAAYNSSKQDYTGAAPRGANRTFAGLEAYRKQHGRLLDRFAAFSALQEKFRAIPWHQWPDNLRTPDSAGVARFAEEHAHRIDYHTWTQWVADRQLAAAAAAPGDGASGLYLDLAVGVSANGADAWADSDTYVTGASIGAPPDAFNLAGQDWGTPPPNPLTLRANAYAPFIAALRANMRHAQVLRIDHVMGLQRLYWVPSGQSAQAGAYVRYPLDDMLGIIALESHRNRCMVVGEDLGTLPEGFRERMAAARVLSYRLSMFERYSDGLFRRPVTYPQLAVATFGTHDLPTIRSWWEGQDIEVRRTLGLTTEAEAGREREGRQEDRQLLLAALRDQQLVGPDQEKLENVDELVMAIQRFVARSPSALMIANLTDMLSEAAQINVPGTVAECPNWRHRSSLPLTALATNPLIRHIAAAVSAERRKDETPSET
jgi:4-alpha-glucanotransferase